MADIQDIVMQCTNTAPHDPHLWFDPSMFPNGCRCYGILQPIERTREWPPHMETKSDPASVRIAP